jgi:hypothetical protein
VPGRQTIFSTRSYRVTFVGEAVGKRPANLKSNQRINGVTGELADTASAAESEAYDRGILNAIASLSDKVYPPGGGGALKRGDKVPPRKIDAHPHFSLTSTNAQRFGRSHAVFY